MKKRFLIVEDEFLIALGYRIELERRGHEVAGICPDTESALELLSHQHIDYALVDIYIKGESDGIDFVRRGQSASSSTRYVFITGNFEDATKKRADAVQNDGFFIKPVEIDEILDHLNLQTTL